MRGLKEGVNRAVSWNSVSVSLRDTLPNEPGAINVPRKHDQSATRERINWGITKCAMVKVSAGVDDLTNNH